MLMRESYKQTCIKSTETRGHCTYKGDPNCASMDCVDLVLVLGIAPHPYIWQHSVSCAFHCMATSELVPAVALGL